MKVIFETLREARECVAGARNVCRDAAAEMGHDVACCPCGVCVSKRHLDVVIRELGTVERPELDRGR